MITIAPITSSLRFLLLQVRNPDDDMSSHEIECFARVLECPRDRIEVFDLLGPPLTRDDVAHADVILLGGSGDYSAAGQGEWLERALDSLRLVHDQGAPTFASCWGCQAMARAMGGQVVTDLSRAEVGTHHVYCTDAAKSDPIFAPLGDSFLGQMGHQDRVAELPTGSTLLGQSERAIQAYRFDDAPIYCTQFHPELTREDLLVRLEAYPQYVEQISGLPFDEFTQTMRDTTPSEDILKRFIAAHFGAAVDR